MIPILFPATATQNDFNTHGLGDLIDAISCATKLTDEGEWELGMEYPGNGAYASLLQLQRIILVKATHWHERPQAFRIYKIKKEISGSMVISAEHISYDLTWIPIAPFIANSATEAFSSLMTNSMLPNTFEFEINNITTTGKLSFSTPMSARKLLLDGDNSIKGIYGGDLMFDNYKITLSNIGGEDRHVSLDYGVDLIDLDQEENNTKLITAVIPYYHSGQIGETNYVYRMGNICRPKDEHGQPISFVVDRIDCVDLTAFFPNAVPTVTQLNDKCDEWIAEEEIGIPEISLEVDYAWFGQDVRLHDAVRVRMLNMGIDVTSKVTEYSYDCLNERPTKVTVGKSRESAYFNLEDASRLRKGLLPPERIRDQSISSSKLGPNSVTDFSLAPNSVNEESLTNDAVSLRKSSLIRAIGSALLGENLPDAQSAFISMLTNKRKDNWDKAASASNSAYAANQSIEALINAVKNSGTYSSFKDAVDKDVKPT